MQACLFPQATSQQRCIPILLPNWISGAPRNGGSAFRFTRLMEISSNRITVSERWLDMILVTPLQIFLHSDFCCRWALPVAVKEPGCLIQETHHNGLETQIVGPWHCLIHAGDSILPGLIACSGASSSFSGLKACTRILSLRSVRASCLALNPCIEAVSGFIARAWPKPCAKNVFVSLLELC